MKPEEITFRITGNKRLLMHGGRLADPLEQVSKDLKRLTSKKPKTEADHEAISKTEWFGGLWLHDDEPCLPAEALMSTFVKTARGRRLGPQARAGLVVKDNAPLVFDGPRDVDALWLLKKFVLRVNVRIGQSMTQRTRACFDNWSATFTATYFPSLLSRDDVKDLYVEAGFTQGLGDWRPQNGTFDVEVIE